MVGSRVFPTRITEFFQEPGERGYVICILQEDAEAQRGEVLCPKSHGRVKGRGGVHTQVCLTPVSTSWLLALVESPRSKERKQEEVGLAAPGGLLPATPAGSWRKTDA